MTDQDLAAKILEMIQRDLSAEKIRMAINAARGAGVLDDHAAAVRRGQRYEAANDLLVAMLRSIANSRTPIDLNRRKRIKNYSSFV